jgi:predicted MPP superfamily phosphohydrolase
LQPILAAAGIAALWGLFEAQWVEFRDIEVPLEGLPPDLDGFTILHLSDPHLGTVSLNGWALEKAVDRARRDRYDLVVITGDLLTRQRGERRLRRALACLRARHGVCAILGNHDVDASRDPFNAPSDASGIEAEGALLLEDASVTFAHEGAVVQVVGVDPRDWKMRRPERLADPGVHLRVLLTHFPDAVHHLEPGVFDLILAGHLHGGQICLPFVGGRLRLEHLRAQHWEGLHRTRAGTLHVSRGLGTSFVPFRVLSRPEATKLTLRCHTGSIP